MVTTARKPTLRSCETMESGAADLISLPMPGFEEPLDKYVDRFMQHPEAIRRYPIEGRRGAVAHWRWFGRR